MHSTAPPLTDQESSASECQWSAAEKLCSVAGSCGVIFTEGRTCPAFDRRPLGRAEVLLCSAPSHPHETERVRLCGVRQDWTCWEAARVCALGRLSFTTLIVYDLLALSTEGIFPYTLPCYCSLYAWLSCLHTWEAAARCRYTYSHSSAAAGRLLSWVISRAVFLTPHHNHVQSFYYS